MAKKKAEKPAPAGGGVVSRVRRSQAGITDAKQTRAIDAYDAAEACELFGLRIGKGGGAAFVRWCERNEIDPRAKKPAKDWREALEKFAARPIHGHRRTKVGGNHRINKAHRR